jgi:radical SAM protein with 4Fe4S-binding SPASM domain
VIEILRTLLRRAPLRAFARSLRIQARLIAADKRSPRDAQARRFRLESFGGIIQSMVPRALVFVDRAYAKDYAAGIGISPKQWSDPSKDGQLNSDILSAPLEAHLQLTNRCNAGCSGCYTGASPNGDGAREWQLPQWKNAITELAAAGVFHVALGGGESATLPWLGELAEHCWQSGIVPNLTTSGLDGLDMLLPIVDRFGQINVSLDGIGPAYAAVRGFDGFAKADAAIRALRARKREIGINVVVTRSNFSQLDELFAYAAELRLSEVELLRYKPSGRGARGYQAVRCSDGQHRLFLPTILAGAKRHRVRIKVDCSYTPMLAFHNPGRDVLAKLAVFGCTGGDYLIGAKAQGQLTACSFAAPPPADVDQKRPTVDQLRTYWSQPNAFGVFRTWQQAQQPCQRCEYLTVCRGGCRVVAAHHDTPSAPDPECPTVVDFRRKSSGATKAKVVLPVI